MTLAATTRTKHPSLRIATLIGVYLLLGLIGLGVVSIAAWMADPCGPFCTSASGSSYADLQDTVLGLGGFVYLMAAVPLAMLRARRIVWLIPPLVFALVTIGGVAILATGAKGDLCDCGYGAGVTATCGARLSGCGSASRESGLAHEPLAGGGNERHRLGEEDAHCVAKGDRLLVEAALDLNLRESGGGQLDGQPIA